MGRKPSTTSAEAPKIAGQIEFWPLARLKADPRNARTHSEAQIAQIAASIEQFGFAGAILADAKGIVAGHGRKLGLEALFAAGKIAKLPNGSDIPQGFAPVIDCTGWSPEQRRAYMIADNQIALNAGWDMKLLALEFNELKLGGFDVGVLGFGESEMRALARKRVAGGTDPDDVPPVPKKPVARPGDLWTLGDHRLLCGDSTSKSDVSRVLNGARPHLAVTDPPYGVNYDASWREKAGASRKGTVAAGKVLNDDRADWREAWALFPGAVMYVWHGALHAATVQASLQAVGFQIRAQIVWVKTRPVLGRGHYHWQHEPALYAVQPGQDEHWQPRFEPMHELAEYAVREGGKGHWDGGRQQSTVWMIEHTKSDTGHSTQKPVEAMRRPIINNSAPGDLVYEPFCGSGTTLIACEMEARKCIALELNPAYCDVIVERWQAFTGGKAKRERRGAAA
jgi:DNA modification methylase